jgi:AcrR family transcriptional regulator
MPIARRRLSPEASRHAALEAARELLIEAGPQAVTLKAVAGRINRTHANLLHHFGSAAGLQRALSEYLVEAVVVSISETMQGSPPGERDVRHIVDLTFDSFDREGAGALATWMLMTGNEDALDPIIGAVHKVIDGLAKDASEQRLMQEDTLALILMALGDSLMGAPMAAALGLPRETGRALATELIAGRIVRFHEAGTPDC